MPSIRCAHCKNVHQSVAAVRACSTRLTAPEVLATTRRAVAVAESIAAGQEAASLDDLLAEALATAEGITIPEREPVELPRVLEIPTCGGCEDCDGEDLCRPAITPARTEPDVDWEQQLLASPVAPSVDYSTMTYRELREAGIEHSRAHRMTRERFARSLGIELDYSPLTLDTHRALDPEYARA